MTAGSASPSMVARAFALAGGVVFVASLVTGVTAYALVFGRVPSPWSLEDGAMPVLLDVALFTAFALHHSLFARAGLKRRIHARVSERLERSVYVWIASTMFIAVCMLWQPVPGELWRVGLPWAFPLVGVQLTGLLMTGAASRQLDVLVLAGIRQALDLPRPPHAGLIRSGGYRLVRHPIYFGWVLMVWPTPHMSGTRLVFAAISTLYLAVAIPFEERSLRREFGPAYDAYTAAVKWKMVPFIY